MKVMVIVKATKGSEAGELPSTELLAAMGKYNEELVEAGILLSAEGLQPRLEGGTGAVLRRESRRDRRAVCRDERGDRRLLAVEGAIHGGGDRVGEAVPESDDRGLRHRDPAGVRGR